MGEKAKLELDEENDKNYRSLNRDISQSLTTLFDRNHVNIEFHQLIWLDSGDIDICQRDRLRNIVDYVKTFNNSTACQQYIETTCDITTFLITSGHCGRQILPVIHDLNHIKSIYIFCRNKSYHQQWTTNFSKVKAISTDFDELFNDLFHDVNNSLQRDHHIAFHRVDSDDTTTDSEYSKWLPYLVDFLSSLPYPNDYQQQLIDALKSYYHGNVHEMITIEEFKQTYTPHTAIRWYTRPTFVFRLLNKALRQRNIPIIFLFGFFLKDLNQQLRKEYEKFKQTQSSFKVYRGQLIAKYEIDTMKDLHRRIPLVINSFLSTTIDRNISMLFLDVSNENLENVLFEIDIDLNEPCRPFADISYLSQIPDENEILFSIGTLFHLNELVYDQNDHLWIAKLTLHDHVWLETNSLMKEIDRYLLKKKINTFIDLIFSATYDEIEILFHEILRLFPEENWILAVKYTCLGEKNSAESDDESSLDDYQRAIEIWLDYVNDEELNCSIDIADLYERMAGSYRSMKKLKFAEENFDLAIQYYRRVIDKAEITNRFDLLGPNGCIYRRCAHAYSDKSKITNETIDLIMAIEFYEKELSTIQPSSDIELRKCYSNLGAIYKTNGNYYQAFKYYECALNMYLQDSEMSSFSIYCIAQQLVEICSRDTTFDENLILKYQLLVQKYTISTPSIQNQIVQSHEKLAEIDKTVNRSDMATEPRLSLKCKSDIACTLKCQSDTISDKDFNQGKKMK